MSAKVYNVIPQGGLCNRMRALDSALALAAVTGRKLMVQWQLDPGLNCRFEDLFEIPPGIARLDTRDYTDRFAKQRKTITKRLDRLRYDRCLYEQDLARYRAEHDDLASLGEYNQVLIASCMRFYGNAPLFRDFVPTAANQATIDGLSSRFAPRTVGVHIRRSDHLHAIAHSPTALFVREMEHALAQDPDTHFFLATDCPSTEGALSKRFGDRLIVHPKHSLARDDPDAIKDALVDLYGLAACTRLLGSVHSSFSETAAQIGGIPLTLIDVRQFGDA